MFKITVAGQCYVREGNGRTFDNYKEVFLLPKKELALNVIQNSLLTNRLLSKDANSCGFRSCGIVEIEEVEDKGKGDDLGNINTGAMSRLQLSHLCFQKDIKVTELLNDETMDRIIQNKRKSKQKETITLDDALGSMPSIADARKAVKEVALEKDTSRSKTDAPQRGKAKEKSPDFFDDTDLK